MQIPKEISSAVNKGLYRLSMGDLTCAEMMEYLVSKERKNTGFSEEIAEKTVAFLESEGFLDDKRYLKILLRRYDERKFGPRKIREELIRHRFSHRYVEAAMARRIDYTDRAFALLLREKQTETINQSPKERKKAVDFLVRRGYDYSTALSAVRRIDEDDTFSE